MNEKMVAALAAQYRRTLQKTDQPGEPLPSNASSWPGVSGADWDPPGSTGGARDGGALPTTQVEVTSPVTAPLESRTLPAQVQNPSPEAQAADWTRMMVAQARDMASIGATYQEQVGAIAGTPGPDVRDAVQLHQVGTRGSGGLGDFTASPARRPAGVDVEPHSKIGPAATEPLDRGRPINFSQVGRRSPLRSI